MVPLSWAIGDRCKVGDHVGRISALSKTIATVTVAGLESRDIPIKALELATFELPPKPPKRIVETDISKAIQTYANRLPGVRMARNANVVMPDPETGRMFRRSGLGNGSPDLVGVMTILGIPFAFGIEVKQPGKVPTKNQLLWHAAAHRKGMQVATCQSVEDAERSIALIRRYYMELLRDAAGKVEA